jgi:hypothetical protein
MILIFMRGFFVLSPIPACSETSPPHKTSDSHQDPDQPASHKQIGRGLCGAHFFAFSPSSIRRRMASGRLTAFSFVENGGLRMLVPIGASPSPSHDSEDSPNNS